MRILYVCGYGRSGSTILGRVLAQHGEAVALGEMANAPELLRGAADTQCACGERVNRCPVWGEALLRTAQDVQWPAAAWLSRVLNGPLALMIPKKWLAWLARRCTLSPALPHTSLPAAMDVLIGQCCSGAAVDISKTSYLTCGRPLALAAAGADIQLHLAVRPWRDVRASYVAAHARRDREISIPVATIRVLAGITFSRFTARIVAARLRKPLHVHRMAEILLDASKLADDGPTNHMLTGNRSRNRPIVGTTGSARPGGHSVA